MKHHKMVEERTYTFERNSGTRVKCHENCSRKLRKPLRKEYGSEKELEG